VPDRDGSKAISASTSPGRETCLRRNSIYCGEPSEGLAPIIVQRIGELLRQLRGTGATVLIAEQNMHFCLRVASHATVIDKGQIVYTTTIEDLKANDNIRQRYLAL
jgi:branched-chain amino acid transport system ATP-binding protein